MAKWLPADAGAVTRAVTSDIIGQGIGLATGLQDKFSWASVAASGLSAQFGKFVDKRLQLKAFDTPEGQTIGNFAEHIASGTARAIAAGAARSLIEGSNFGDNVLAALPNVIGQTIGEMVAGGIAQSSQRRGSRIQHGVAEGDGGAYIDIPAPSDEAFSLGEMLGRLNPADLLKGIGRALRGGAFITGLTEDFGASDTRYTSVGEGTGLRIEEVPGDPARLQQLIDGEWAPLRGVPVDVYLNENSQRVYRLYNGEIASAYVGEMPRALRDIIVTEPLLEGYDVAAPLAPLPGMDAHDRGPLVLVTPGEPQSGLILGGSGAPALGGLPGFEAADVGPLILFNDNYTGDDRVKFVIDPDWGRNNDRAAAAFEDGTPGAIYTLDGQRLAPALQYQNANQGGRDIVRWDGFEVENQIVSLIDRKTTITAAPSTNGELWIAPRLESQLFRQSRALSQNPGIRGVIEVPTLAQVNLGNQALTQLGIGNITVRQPRN